MTTQMQGEIPQPNTFTNTAATTAPQPTKLSQLMALQKQIDKLNDKLTEMKGSGNQHPAHWEERNQLEKRICQLYNEFEAMCPAGRQA